MSRVVSSSTLRTPLEPAGQEVARADAAAPLLEAHDVYRRFGGVRALAGASLTVKTRGSVHVLVGENGSGKSTLLRILAGELRADAGRILLDGEEHALASPAAALRRGIVTVTQETTLAPDLSIAENVYLGRRMSRGRLGIRWRETGARARAVLERLELDLDPRLPVRRLRPDQQQMVEIARAMSMDARLLILDEPTSSLTGDEVASLFSVVRRLKERDVTTIFVSHRLDEIFEIGDDLTVLRDGRTVGSGPVAAYDRRSLIERMVGQAHQPLAPRPVRQRQSSSILSLRGVGVEGIVSDATLDVAAGEIVGLAGLVGAGRSELLEAIFGLRHISAGELRIGGRAVRSRGPRDAVACGVGFVPADRKRQGLVLDMSVRENLVMTSTAGRSRLAAPTAARELPGVQESLRAMRIRAESPNARVATLSGGNQQKVVLAKWLAARPKVLLLDEPTRGVDVGAKSEIYRLLSAAATNGLAVLVSSSETPELLEICDRILVMFRGRICAELPADAATEAAIAHYAGGEA